MRSTLRARSRLSLLELAPFCLAIAMTANLTAQCQLQWTAMAGVTGSGESVLTITEWDPDGAGPQPARIVAAGYFHSIGGVAAENIAVFDPITSSWSPLGSGTDNWIWALAVLPNGDLVAGGDFTMAGGVPAANIARWDGAAWSALGSGLTHPSGGEVGALLVLPNGDLVAAGFFSHAGPWLANGIARWDGTSWSPLGAGLNGEASALALLPNGDLVAGGLLSPHLVKWNGTSWSSFGSGLTLPPTAWVESLVVTPGGDLVAGTVDLRFFSSGTPQASVLLWNGATWATLGTATGPSGNWAAINSLSILPSGNLLAAGSWSSGLAGRHIAIHDGASWSSLATSPTNYVNDLAALPSGEHFVGGAFTSIAGAPSGHIAMLTTTCPADVSVTAAGCSGAAGPKSLTATSLPWTGSTFRARADGMPASSIAVSLFGLTASTTPLSALVSQGVPGCALHVSTEAVQPLLPIAGTVHTQLVIPSSVAFAGVTLHHQVLAGELNAQNAITAVTATDALRLVIGSF